MCVLQPASRELTVDLCGQHRRVAIWQYFSILSTFWKSNALQSHKMAQKSNESESKSIQIQM
jgi:hypothetical protein